MSTTKPAEYVLGTGDDELARLALQHRLWGDAAHGLWRRAGIAPGFRVLDVGCGPGHASFDLAQWVTPNGKVVGVDESAGFIEYLNAQARSRGLPQLSGRIGDVQQLGRCIEPKEHYDLAYARWVLCFVKDPEAVVAGVAAALKPGGKFCVHDYFNYRSMSMAPRRASHDKVVAATVKSWEARGGDTDIMGRLPRLLDKQGLEVTHLDVHQRVARGNDAMFTWINVWWRIYAPKLAEMGLITNDDVDALLHDLDEIRYSTTDFVSCPPVYELISVKK